MRIYYLGLLLLFAGCATSGKYAEMLRAWKGKRGDALVASWGTPLRAVTLHDGGRSYTWLERGCETIALTSKDDVIQNFTYEGRCLAY